MNKAFFKSKTVWGILIAIAMVTLNAFHMNVNLAGADTQTVTLLTSLIGTGGMIFAIYGRVKADISGSTKPWYQSKTILSIFLAIAFTVLNYFHVNIPVSEIFGITPDKSTMDVGTGLLSDLTLIFGIIGRVKADQPISKPILK